jgi:hypothetical protein
MILDIFSEVVGFVFLLKWMEDLEAFIDCPDHLQYLSRHDIMLAAFETEAFPKMSKLSAKSK